MTVPGNTDGSTPLLELRGISKSFGSTRALKNVDLQVLPGTVHTILGENGSGKSTLVKVLSGVVDPVEGEMRVAGTPCTLRGPRDARDLGIATVFQEVLVAPNRSVQENVLLGQDSLFRYRVRRAERPGTARAALRMVSNAEFDLKSNCGSLDLMQQHQVTMARAFALKPKLVILDESTAALDIAERDRLFDAIRAHAADGGAAIFISHRLDEVMELSDAVTVLRSGERVNVLDRSQLTERRLLSLLNPETEERTGEHV